MVGRWFMSHQELGSAAFVGHCRRDFERTYSGSRRPLTLAQELTRALANSLRSRGAELSRLTA